LALSGGYDSLRRAASRGVTARLAVFVLLPWDEPRFTTEQREQLWDLFQTPVYAILLGRDGRIAGFECEAQSGFHMAAAGDERPERLCECGRPGPFLNHGADGMPEKRPMGSALPQGRAKTA
jgi:hypothetical protein